MSKLTNLIKGIFNSMGYVLIKKTDVLFRNFENLAQSYELLLNSQNEENGIPTNTIRPKLLSRLLGTYPSEAYFIIQSIYKTQQLKGDVCEFGVAQGRTSALIANEILSSRKKFHLFDSFQGLPKPTEKDRLIDDIFLLGDINAYQGKMACPKDMVLSRLQSVSFPINRIAVHEGFIEKVILNKKMLPTKVSFAYVDFDFYEPIKITLEYLDKVTSTGAIIIVDDFGHFSSGVETAVKEFIKGRDYSLFVPDVKYGYFAILRKGAKW